ncbi:hypothetical protein NBRC110019_16490 [Neptunitalea chrysea]|uniref:Tetratricopeptide repeat protein n=1 Tax=Neptunitalea chrysea TaxID=1647581 RepID=A0A9W6EUH5_9FLAO|nr:tetratricopeptide repeat protein [Neptunitalea chrysea]GLB52609.1 hypothetical protein NBRC110019_16490 [Neptunitalea chrysea]
MKKYIFTIIALLSIYIVSAQKTKADKFYQLGNYTRAIKAYSADTTKAYNQKMIAKSYHNLENYDMAIAHYKKAIVIDSTIQLQKFELAKIYFQVKQFETSANLYNKLIEQDSINPTFYFNLGLVYDHMGKKPLAYANYEKAYEVDSNYLKASYKLATAALLNHRYEHCKELIEKGLAINPNNLDFINLYAVYNYDLSHYEEAIKYFKILINNKQTSATIYRRLGICYYNSNMYIEASKAFEQQKIREPRNPEVYNYLGLCYNKIGDYEKALENLNKAVILKTLTFEEEYEALAFCYQQMKDYKQALKYYELTLKENPKKYILHYKIAITADKCYTDPKKVLPYYEKADHHFAGNNMFKRMITKRLKELNAEIVANTP